MFLREYLKAETTLQLCKTIVMVRKLLRACRPATCRYSYGIVGVSNLQHNTKVPADAASDGTDPAGGKYFAVITVGVVSCRAILFYTCAYKYIAQAVLHSCLP